MSFCIPPIVSSFICCLGNECAASEDALSCPVPSGWTDRGSLLCSGDGVWSLGRFLRPARSRMEPTGGGVCGGRMGGDERASVVHWKGERKQVGRGRKTIGLKEGMREEGEKGIQCNVTECRRRECNRTKATTTSVCIYLSEHCIAYLSKTKMMGYNALR